MKKWIKRIIWLIIIVLVVGGVYIGLQKNKQPTEEYVTEKVGRDTLVQTVEATGSVESARELALNFKTTGRIQNMNVREGDKVAAGRVLATLEAGDLTSRVTDAQASVRAAQAELDRILAGASGEDIGVSEQTVEQNKQAVMAAEKKLESLEGKMMSETNNLKETLTTLVGSEMISIELALNEGKNAFEDEDARNTLGVLDSVALNEAKDDLKTAEGSVVDSRELINATCIGVVEDEVVRECVDNLQNTIILVADFLSQAYEAMQQTITSIELTEAELDILKSTIQTQYAKVAVSKTNIQAAKSGWLDKIVYYNDLIIQTQNEIGATNKALDLSKAQLTLKTAGPRDFEIAAAEAKIEQARASLQLAQANLTNAVIKAPTDGIITKIENKAGEQTSLAQPVMRMVGLSNYEIEVDVPESDIAKVGLEQKTEITLDAFGDDKVFAGSVVFVEPAETVIQDVVYYKVRVQFDEYDQNIKPGMTANLVIETNHKDDVLLVPLRAVKATNGTRFVEVLDEMGVKQERDVKLGLRGDNGYEILDGLEEGDEMVVYVKQNK